MQYSLEMKNARMGAVRDALSGGTLEIANAQLQALVALPLNGGQVKDATLTLAAAPTAAAADGDAVWGRLRAKSGAVVVDGFRVAGAATPEARSAEIVIATTRIGRGGVVTPGALVIGHSQ